MPTVRIEEKGCRGCTLCVETCPVRVFDFVEKDALAVVAHEERCIGCLSCAYVCPSGCIDVDGIVRLRPFHRIEEHAALMRRFLNEKPLADSLTAEDVDEALADVVARLNALSQTVVDTIGKGYRAVGRRAGATAAAHMPEMYEEPSLPLVLAAMQRRFAGAFDFDFTTSGNRASLTFHPCGLCHVVGSLGEKVGEAVLCHLFHEYWAGLVSAFAAGRYRCEVPSAGEVCTMELTPA